MCVHQSSAIAFDQFTKPLLGFFLKDNSITSVLVAKRHKTSAALHKCHPIITIIKPELINSGGLGTEEGTRKATWHLQKAKVWTGPSPCSEDCITSQLKKSRREKKELPIEWYGNHACSVQFTLEANGDGGGSYFPSAMKLTYWITPLALWISTVSLSPASHVWIGMDIAILTLSCPCSV